MIPGEWMRSLNSIVPLDPSLAYSMHKVIETIVDRELVS